MQHTSFPTETRAPRLSRAAWLRLASCALLVAATTGLHATPSASEDALINSLIKRLAAQGTIRFVRNGEEHPASEAAEHMQAKYKHFHDQIVTAEDFIALCATRSEVTKQRYQVKLPDGQMRDAAAYMTEELRKLRAVR